MSHVTSLYHVSVSCMSTEAQQKEVKIYVGKEGNYYHFVLKWISSFNVQIVNQSSLHLPVYLYYCKCLSFAGNLELKSS